MDRACLFAVLVGRQNDAPVLQLVVDFQRGRRHHRHGRTFDESSAHKSNKP